jgi:hypothetical protein
VATSDDGERSGALAPSGYDELLALLKQRVQASRARAVRAANVELLRLYWSIGRDILDRQERSGWGSKVIDRLAFDLRQAFPDIPRLLGPQPALHASGRCGVAHGGRVFCRHRLQS